MKKSFYLVIIAGLIMASCSKKQEDKAVKPEDTETIAVKVEKASIQEVEQIYEFSSTVDAAVKNYISSAGGTRIEKIHVEVGDRVTKGQKLVTMENTNLATAKVQLMNSKNDVDRMEALYLSGGISKQQLDQIKTQYDVAKRNIDNLESNIHLVSPISGIVTMRNFDNGDVSATQPILQVMQITPVKLKFSMNEKFYNRVKIGMKVSAKVDIFGDDRFDGRVNLIAPIIDPNTRSFGLEASFTNSNQKLRPGMFARVEINLGKNMSVVIPDRAVIKQNGTNDKYVFIEKDGVVDYRKIELGRRLGDTYEIISGIEEGENIVIEGYTKLVSGSKVKVK
ncbi:MAG: efflux RND transporter periplasmic adaptor subunit [Bacteroidales bacterium]|jgi:RND family efflux transporter MFP subunit|nr:efflux RND transporter periplasmic adaptor subunit [Bacteroidales bacterium]